MTLLNLTDVETYFKTLRRGVIEQVAPTLREKHLEIEPELTAKLARIPDMRIFEGPISTMGRTFREPTVEKNGGGALIFLWRCRRRGLTWGVCESPIL